MLNGRGLSHYCLLRSIAAGAASTGCERFLTRFSTCCAPGVLGECCLTIFRRGRQYTTAFAVKREGVFESINTSLRKAVRTNAGREEEPSTAVLDSQSVKTTEKGDIRLRCSQTYQGSQASRPDTYSRSDSGSSYPCRRCAGRLTDCRNVGSQWK